MRSELSTPSWSGKGLGLACFSFLAAFTTVVMRFNRFPAKENRPENRSRSEDARMASSGAFTGPGR